MGSREKQPQPDVPPFEYRAGVTMPPIGGMVRRGDPSTIPPHRLHLGVNIRLADADAGSRPGLSVVDAANAEEGACITGIFEITDESVGVYITKLMKAALDGNGIPLENGTMQIMAFNEEKDPPEQNYWDESTTIVKLVPAPWRTGSYAEACFSTFQAMNGKILIANGESVHEANFSEDSGLPRLDLAHLFSLPEAAAGNIVSTCIRSERVDDAQTGSAFDKEVLYMGCEGGEVWRYDGTTVELVHTLTSGGRMQIINWRGVGLVAAGDSAAGFSYQEQPGFAWVDQVWGQDFNCNGLCDFLGEVVFVGDETTLFGGKWSAYALHWNGSGAPVVFASDIPFSGNDLDYRYRSPVVCQGAVHWLRYAVEGEEPPFAAFAYISRFINFTTGVKDWIQLTEGGSGSPDQPDAVGFFIEYAGALLFLSRGGTPAVGVPWVDGSQGIVRCISGDFGVLELIYAWAAVPASPEDEQQLQPGVGYEAIAI